jgi:hypothetical protein
LRDYIFAPNSFKVSNDLYNLLARERRGFDFFSGPEDPKIHDQVLGYQTRVLSHLLHPNTLQRIVDSELYGNTYKLTEYMSDLNDAMFKADKSGDINTFRQNLQATYVTRLIEIVSGKNSSRYKIPVQSMAIYNLEKIMKYVKNNKSHNNIINTCLNCPQKKKHSHKYVMTYQKFIRNNVIHNGILMRIQENQ